MSDQAATYRGRVKYDERLARRYQIRKEGKHRAEMRMLDRAFKLVPRSHRVLDVPCGGGRVTVHLARQGYRVTAADLSGAMVRIAQENMARHELGCPVDRQDIERLTYADRGFDTVVCFRLFHHFPIRAIRRQVVAELCRVAGERVVISYFSPWSFTSLQRRVRAALGGRKSEKFTTSLRELRSYFLGHGFELLRDVPRCRWVHTLHVAVFGRRTGRP